MNQKFFFRNVRASELLDIFFISAIASLLLVRLFLHVSGYPQLGGNGLHIGHMLWAGLCMLASLTINFAFLGIRAQRLSALTGGIGFGIFVDEIGKFITSDNNYFYRPAIGIIYAIFVILYLTFNFLGRKQNLSSREYQLNALARLEEAIVRDMDPVEMQQAQQLLAKSNKRSKVTNQLKQLLSSIDLVPENQPPHYKQLLYKLDQVYLSFWHKRNNRLLVRSFFIFESAIFILAIAIANYNNLDDISLALSGHPTYGASLIFGQLASALVAACFVINGTLKLKDNRLEAFEDFRRATLINLLLTEFFIFSRIEFQALPGFAFNVLLLLFITYVMHQERRPAHGRYV